MQLPDSLLSSLEEESGFNKKKFLEAHEKPAPVSIRINPVKKISPPGGATSVPWTDLGFYLPERPVFTLDPLFHAGTYYVQEASSMFLEAFFRQVMEEEPLRVLDLCAAPGGKSTLLSSLLSDDSLLISNEVIRPRSGVLADNLTKWGRIHSFVTNNDPRDFQRLPGFFDIVVVDAPCSGSGLFRKDAAAITEWSEENVALCSQRQQRILADVWPTLREGGVLIYSTCSYSNEENEQVLDWLSSSFACTSIPFAGSYEGILEVRTEQENYGYRFWPDRVEGEGFFIAAFQKTEDQEDYAFRNTAGGKNKNRRTETAAFTPWVDDLSLYAWVEKNGDYFLINPEHRPEFEVISQNLYLRKAGIRLGKLAGPDLIPDHELALSTVLSSDVPRLELSREDALRFLKREDFAYETPQKGWHLVSYQGHGLGWVKVLPNRLNNYLPKDWRILMDIREN